jgi:hypothetical protein
LVIFQKFISNRYNKCQINSSNHDLTSISKRSSTLSSSQKNLSLSAAQRLDNLIQGAQNDLPAEGKDRIILFRSTSTMNYSVFF